MSIARSTVVFACCLMLMGCTFHSRQLDAIRQLVSDKPDPLEAHKWMAEWNGNQYAVYAVRVSENQLLFSNYDGVQINFEGDNLTEAHGILPNGDVSKVELQGDELLYFVNDRLVARHQCVPWVRAEFSNGDYQLNQNCYGREAYINEFRSTTEGSGTRLSYLIHPEYPPIIIVRAN